MNKIPVVHCISNIVSANDCANILLACGFSPIMADEPQEMDDIAQVADACVINLGTPGDRKYEAAIAAGKAYNRLKKTVVIDPVGIAVSSYRRENLMRLLNEVHPTVVRCNLNEAIVLIDMLEDKKGVQTKVSKDRQTTGIDSRENAKINIEASPKSAMKLAKLLNCTVMITGIKDSVSDGSNLRIISGGSDMLKQVTGAGCMLSAITGAYCASGRFIFDSTVRAAKFFKRAAEYAESHLSEGGGTGELRMRMIDAAWHLSLKTRI